jgi:hypothetical protein
MASAISTVVYEINTAVLLEEMISMFLRKTGPSLVAQIYLTQWISSKNYQKLYLLQPPNAAIVSSTVQKPPAKVPKNNPYRSVSLKAAMIASLFVLPTVSPFILHLRQNYKGPFSFTRIRDCVLVTKT